MQIYPTDLTDSQWAKIENLFDNRKRRHPLRAIINALFYITKSGIQWRMLPKEYPRWQLVYCYFRKWTAEGLIEEMHGSLHAMCRKQAGREESPSLGLIDSQSVKTSSITQKKGYDGGKKIQGRKRHTVTDTLGFIMAVVGTQCRYTGQGWRQTCFNATSFQISTLKENTGRRWIHRRY